MWTKTRSLAGLLADGVLVDAILIPPRLPIPPTSTRKVGGRRKQYGNREMLGWLNASLQSTETKDELSTTLYLQSKKIMSRWTVRILVLVTKSKYSVLKYLFCFSFG